MSYFIEKEQKKTPFEHIRFGGSKSPVKGLMKVLISWTKNSKKKFEVLDELELFIDKKVIFDEK
jgi:hypothetical protein